jgi:hypothetical protein
MQSPISTLTLNLRIDWVHFMPWHSIGDDKVFYFILFCYYYYLFFLIFMSIKKLEKLLYLLNLKTSHGLADVVIIDWP